MHDSVAKAKVGVAMTDFGGVAEGDSVVVEIDPVVFDARDFSKDGGCADKLTEGRGNIEFAVWFGHRGAEVAVFYIVVGISDGLKAFEIGFVGCADPLVP